MLCFEPVAKSPQRPQSHPDPALAAPVSVVQPQSVLRELGALFNAQSLDGVDGCGAASGDHTRNASGDDQNHDRYRHDA